jgi:predicted Zn-dependent peptidase
MGSWNNLKFDLAVGYLKFIGTDKYSASDFQKELYKYGLDLSVSADKERSYITISGLNSSYDKGVELLEHLIAHAKPDSKAYSDYVGRILKDRLDQKANQDIILWDAMYNYGVYGSDNPQKYLLTEKELKSIDPAELVSLIKGISGFKHKVFYYGPSEKEVVKATVKKNHLLPAHLADVPAPKKFEQIKPLMSQVYVVDFDINQANILMLSNGEKFSKDLMPSASIYSEYYGGEMSSVVFQDIRESKALAYSAFSGYEIADKPDRLNTLIGYLGTQSDKLPLATDALMQLMNKMPKAKNQYDMSRESIIKKINSERITKEQIFWTWQRNMDRGINYDIRKDVYEAAKTMSIDDFEKFFNSHIKGQNFTFLILGKKDKLDQKALQSLGEVKELNLEDLFGY